MRHMDKEHLIETRDQGVVSACLSTRIEYETTDRIDVGPNSNDHTWCLPRDGRPRAKGQHCACRLPCGQTIGW